MRWTETLDRYAPYALAALRIVAALIFMEHGTQKLFGFPAPPASGLPPALSLSWIGAILEFGGGLLILLGLFTRPVAFVLSGEMAVAYWQAHAPRGLWPIMNRGEVVVLFSFIFLFFAAHGAGRYSLDALLMGRRARV